MGVPRAGVDALWEPELYQLHASVEDTHWWFRARRRIMVELARGVLGRAPSATVVDVGCGTGANIAALSSDYRCVGIDPSKEAIQLARQRFPAVQFHAGHAPAALGALAAEASLFLLMDVLEHVPDDFLLLSRLLAAASPGARFLITVPADPRLWSRHDVTLGHFRRYPRDRLEMLWRDLPVRAHLVTPFNARLHPLLSAARLYGRTIGRAIGERGTDIAVPPRVLNRLLESVFAGEAPQLVAALTTQRSPFRRGVSFLALIERLSGQLQPRSRPMWCPPDGVDPRSAAEAS